MEVKDVKNQIVLLRQDSPVRERSAQKSGGPRSRGDAENEALLELKRAVRETTAVERRLDRGIRIEIERDLKMIVVKIVDNASGEVVRQVPMAEAIAVSRRIREFLARKAQDPRGLLVSEEA